MRRFLSFALITTLLLVIVGVAVGIGLHLAASTHGMTVTVDGESIDGPVVAALFGGAAALGVAILCVTVLAILMSVAIVVPVLLLLVPVGILIALVVGLSPLLVPVLLVLGAYVLLSRRAKRRSTETLPPSTAAS